MLRKFERRGGGGRRHTAESWDMYRYSGPYEIIGNREGEMEDLLELVNQKVELGVMDANREGKAIDTIKLMEEVGLDRGSEVLSHRLYERRKIESAVKLGYHLITQEKIDRFLIKKNQVLRDIAWREYQVVQQQLVSTPNGVSQFANNPSPFGPNMNGEYIWEESALRDYLGIPPVPVLEKLKVAQEQKCFDYFTIASVILGPKRVPDPILFGRFNDCKDRFFIAQWGDDISLDDVI